MYLCQTTTKNQIYFDIGLTSAHLSIKCKMTALPRHTCAVSMTKPPMGALLFWYYTNAVSRHMIKLRNLWLVVLDQGPLTRFLRNLRKGHMRGLRSRRSHENANGQPKIAYGSKKSATKAAQKMQKKYGYYYSNYKCLFCDGYHIGRNSDNKQKTG
jgi:hypothetical protein